MRTEDPKARLKELYLPPQEFVQVDVPSMQFVMIDGEGNPDGADFQQSLKWLFATVYPMKQVGKARMGKDWIEPPLEALWWADDLQDLISGNKDKLKWRIMIVTADWVDQDLFQSALATAQEKMANTSGSHPPATLRLERFHEGKCVQIMHVGPNSEEPAVLERLHKEYMPAHNLTATGHHHEIYLNDPKRVAREKCKTVLRQPVK